MAYSNLLIKLEGLDDGVLDHYCHFVTSACKMMKLQVNKKYDHLLSSTGSLTMYKVYCCLLLSLEP